MPIAPGAIVVEWNVKQPSGQQAGAGMWDSHFRYASIFSPEKRSYLLLLLDWEEVCYFTETICFSAERLACE